MIKPSVSPNSMSRIRIAILILTAASLALAAGPAPCAAENPIPVLMTAQQKTAAELDRLDAELKRAAQALGTTGLTGDAARSVLSGLCASFRHAVDCAAVDASGTMVTIEPAAYRPFEGKQIGDQEQVQRALQGQSALSHVFRAVEGFPAADAEHPVTTADGRPLGTVSLLFKPEALLGEIIVPLVQGTPMALWAMERDGHILYDADTPQVGLNLFTAPIYRPYPGLRNLGRRIAAAPEGKGAYRFRNGPSKEIVRKNACWRSVSLYGTEWRLVAIQVHVGPSGKKRSPSPASPPEAGLASLAANPTLGEAMSDGDKTSGMRLFREFYDATPGLYSVQWIDEAGINRFGYPPENSLTDYDYRLDCSPRNQEILRILDGRIPALFEAPLFEGRTGLFSFRPLFHQGRYLGMVYLNRVR